MPPQRRHNRPGSARTPAFTRPLPSTLPHRTFNPEDTKRGKKPIPQEQAMGELLEVLKSTKPDGFEPTIVQQTADYVYVEYKSPIFG